MISNKCFADTRLFLLQTLLHSMLMFERPLPFLVFTFSFILYCRLLDDCFFSCILPVLAYECPLPLLFSSDQELRK